MEFAIPVIPGAILVVLQFLSPYVVSVFANFNWDAKTKKAVAVVISFILAAVVLVVSWLVGWVPQDTTPLGIVTLVLLGLAVQQAAYALILKRSADALMERTS